MKLTDEQIDAIWANSTPTNFEARSFARAIEAALASQGDALTEKQEPVGGVVLRDRQPVLVGNAALILDDDTRLYTHPAPVNQQLLAVLKHFMPFIESEEGDERQEPWVKKARAALVQAEVRK